MVLGLDILYLEFLGFWSSSLNYDNKFYSSIFYVSGMIGTRVTVTSSVGEVTTITEGMLLIKGATVPVHLEEVALILP